MNQEEVNRLEKQLEPALQMHEEQAWTKEGALWQKEPRHGLIVKGMKGLARLTTTAWATRVWMLQEYILASQVFWIGCDLVSLKIRDILPAALLDISDTLNIDECLGDEFQNLYGYFSGVSNTRLNGPTGRA